VRGAVVTAVQGTLVHEDLPTVQWQFVGLASTVLVVLVNVVHALQARMAHPQVCHLQPAVVLVMRDDLVQTQA
jgi:hypothetical protein